MAPHTSEVLAWELLESDEETMVLLVVDDAVDDELSLAIADADLVPADGFAGVWGASERDEHWLLEFHLVQVGGPLQRAFVTDELHRALLEAVLVVPHVVALMPEVLFDEHASTADRIRALGGSMVVGVDDRSELVADVLAERDDTDDEER